MMSLVGRTTDFVKRPASVATALTLVLAACTAGAPSTSVSPAPPSGTQSGASPTASASTATATPQASTTASAATPTEAPTDAEPSATTSAAGSNTFVLVLADGPRAGTWEVSEPVGEVANCKYLPDLERWIATWFGPPPVTFIDVRGETDDPSLLFSFAEDDGTELSFLPSGDVTFEADDRGDTATLTWVSETNDGTYFDATGNSIGDEPIGQVELTIECGSIFRYAPT
jgi:hypothetical protein